MAEHTLQRRSSRGENSSRQRDVSGSGRSSSSRRSSSKHRRSSSSSSSFNSTSSHRSSSSSSGRTSSGSSRGRRSSSSRSRRSARSSRSKQGLLALFVGICVILLIWLVAGDLRKRDVVEWDGLDYRADGTGVRGVRYSSFVNDSEYVFVITPADLPEAEDFTLTTPAALELPDAIAAARGTLDKYLSIEQQSEWHMVHVAMNHCAGTKWYYTVSFKPGTGNITDEGIVSELRIPVLMDGRAVKGILRPRVKSRAKELESAALALGLTPEELLSRRRESAEQAQGRHSVTLISHVDTKVYKFEIPSEALSQQQDCDLNQPLLLTFHDAAATALQYSQLYLPAGQGMRWRIKELSLNRWNGSDKWYFLADFRLQGADYGVIVPQLLVPILPDGQEVKGQLLQTSPGF